MNVAIEVVQVYLKAPKEFQSPRTSLFPLTNCNEKSAKLAALSTVGRRLVFFKKLLTYVLRRDVYNLAHKLATGNNFSHPFKDEAAHKDCSMKTKSLNL